MPSAHSTQQHYDGIDVLRLGAALAVLVFHYAFWGAATGDYTCFDLPILAPVAKYGFLGVELFFIISGFVIARSAEGRSALTFARARFLRIYPAFVVAMTITALLGVTIGDARFEVSLVRWLSNLTLFPTALGHPFVDGVYWSLNLEIIFYGWVTLFIALGWFEHRRLRIVAVWLAVSAIVNAVAPSSYVHVLLLTSVASHFAGGILLYEIKQRGVTIAKCALMLCAIVMSIGNVLHRVSDSREIAHATFDNTVLAVIVLAIYAVFFAAISLPRVPRIGRWAGIAGAMSYPLYLLHQHIGFMLVNRLGDRLPTSMALALVTGAMLISAIAFALWIEPPARRLMSRMLDMATMPWRPRSSRRLRVQP